MEKYPTYIPIIGVKLYSNHPKNINHVHKYSKDLLSIILPLGNVFSGGDTVFYGGVIYSDLVKKYHAINILHGRCVVGAFETYFHKITLWRIQRAVSISILHKYIFPHFFHRAYIFYNR